MNRKTFVPLGRCIFTTSENFHEPYKVHCTVVQGLHLQHWCFFERAQFYVSCFKHMGSSSWKGQGAWWIWARWSRWMVFWRLCTKTWQTIHAAKAELFALRSVLRGGKIGFDQIYTELRLLVLLGWFLCDLSFAKPHVSCCRVFEWSLSDERTCLCGLSILKTCFGHSWTRPEFYNRRTLCFLFPGDGFQVP